MVNIHKLDIRSLCTNALLTISLCVMAGETLAQKTHSTGHFVNPRQLERAIKRDFEGQNCVVDTNTLESRMRKRYPNGVPDISREEVIVTNILTPADTSIDRLYKGARSGDLKSMQTLMVIAYNNNQTYAAYILACKALEQEGLLALTVLPDIANELALTEQDPKQREYFTKLGPKLLAVGSVLDYPLLAMQPTLENQTTEDATKKVEFIKRAARSGNSEYFPIYANYLQEMEPKHLRDYRLALELLQKAEASNPPPEFTFNNFGWTYLQGYGVKKDAQKAYQYFLKSTERGNVKGMYNIATMYRNGDGLPKSEEKAYQWYERAAKAGGAVGAYQLGIYYFNGEVVPRDYNMAMNWFLKAVDLGEPLATDYIASQYFDGLGVKQDYVKAKKWLDEGVKNHIPNSYNTLAYMYEKGIGPVQQNPDLAAENYFQAAKRGNERAANNLKALCNKGAPKACSLSNTL